MNSILKFWLQLFSSDSIGPININQIHFIEMSYIYISYTRLLPIVPHFRGAHNLYVLARYAIKIHTLDKVTFADYCEEGKVAKCL